MNNVLNKKLIISAIILGAFLILVVALIVWKIVLPEISENNLNAEKNKMSAEDRKTAAEKTNDLIQEVRDLAEKTKSQGDSAFARSVNIPMNNASSAAVVIAAPGNSPIDMKTGEVVTIYGDKANNQAVAGSGEAPRQSSPINPDNLPSSAIKININISSMEPKEFRVKAGQVVLLSATAASNKMETLVFADPSLQAVAIGLLSGETRVITFRAPERKGEYVFFSDIADHRENGVAGKMVVE